MKRWLRNLGRVCFATGCLFLLYLTGLLVYSKWFPPPEHPYVPPESVKVTAGGGPLQCDFSQVEGPVLTGVVPRYQRSSLNVKIPRGYLKNPVSGGRQGADGTVLMFMKIDTFLPDQKPYGSSPSDDDLMMLVWDAFPLKEIFKNFSNPEEISLTRRDKNFPELLYTKSKDNEKDLYYNLENNYINDVISCDLQNDRLRLQCQHYFRFKSVDIMLNYRKLYLQDWKAVRERAEKFSQCIISQ